MRSVVIAGASLAGLSAARALRAEGFEGRITLVGDEQRPPYDRPPLSKEFLLGTASVSDVDLTTPEDEALGLDWHLGTAATSLDPRGRRVVLADGRDIVADGVVIATGARARALPGSEGLSGVHTLRTVEDALALRASLSSGGPLVVIGAGFVGAEVASSALTAGIEVSVVEAVPVPLAGALGSQMGSVCAGLHADHGVRLHCGTPVRDLLGRERVEGVRLVDGTVLPAATVVVGIGAVPNVEWLTGSQLAVGDGVLTDAGCATNVPHVVAVGDCAASYDAAAGRHVRTEHWTQAQRQPASAVRTLLGSGGGDERPGVLPYFWSEQYGVRIQFAGHQRDGDSVRIVTGDPEDRSFLAVYERDDGEVTAVLGMDQPKQFTRWRRHLATRRSSADAAVTRA